jgi:hypothetical protein
MNSLEKLSFCVFLGAKVSKLPSIYQRTATVNKSTHRIRTSFDIGLKPRHAAECPGASCVFNYI